MKYIVRDALDLFKPNEWMIQTVVLSDSCFGNASAIVWRAFSYEYNFKLPYLVYLNVKKRVFSNFFYFLWIIYKQCKTYYLVNKNIKFKSKHI